MPGTRPKLIISANESSWIPISDFTLKKRAIKPSKKSKIKHINVKIKTYWISSLFSTRSNTVKHPKNRFERVIMLGKENIFTEFIMKSKTND